MDIHAKDNKGNTALHYAVFLKGGGCDIVQFLLKIGLDPHVKNNQGYTAIQIARQLSKVDLGADLLEREQLLSLYQKDTENDPTSQDITDLQRFELPEMENVQAGYYTLPKTLPDSFGLFKTAINYEDDYQRSFIHIAAMRNDAKALINFYRENQEMNVFAQDKNGNTALHYAVLIPEAKDIIVFLLNHAINKYTKNKQGHTAIDFLQAVIKKYGSHNSVHFVDLWEKCESLEVPFDADSDIDDKAFKLPQMHSRFVKEYYGFSSQSENVDNQVLPVLNNFFLPMLSPSGAPPSADSLPLSSKVSSEHDFSAYGTISEETVPPSSRFNP